MDIVISALLIYSAEREERDGWDKEMHNWRGDRPSEWVIERNIYLFIMWNLKYFTLPRPKHSMNKERM